MEQLSERTGISVGQLSKIEAGKRGWSRESLQSLADAFQCKVGELLDVAETWQPVPVFGVVEASGVVRPDKKRRVMAPIAFGELLAITVRGDSLYPRYTKGAAIFCGKDPADAEACVGRECLVQTESGQTLLRTVSRGSSKGKYNLMIHNQAPELDCELVSCRPVIFSTPSPTYE